MKTTFTRRLLAMLMALVMAISALPTAAFAAEESATYTKVTETPADWSGEYLLVYEAGSLALDGSLTTIDAVNNYKAVTIADDSITAERSIAVQIEAVDGGYVMKSASGLYLYHSSNANKISTTANQSTAAKYPLTLSVTADGVDIALSSGPHMRFNANADQMRFRYYKSSSYTGQKAVTLYKLEEAPAEPERQSGIITDLTALQDGDTVVVFNPANNKALSTNYTGFYNLGTDITVADGVVSGYTDAELWTLGINADGSYTFSTAAGKKLSMGASYTSTPLDDVNTAWAIEAAATEGCFYIKNVAREAYLEWFADKNNWSSYYNIGSNEALFAQQIYLVIESEDEGEDPGETPEPEQPTGTEYIKADTIEDGDTVLIYNAGSGTVMSSAEASHKLTGVAVTPDGDKIVTDNASVAWTVSVQDGKYTFSQGDKVLGAVQSGSYNNITTGATAHNAWTLSKGTADATWYVKNDTYPANATYGPYYLEYYNGYTIYASNNPSDGQFGFVFYKAPSEPAVPTYTKSELIKDGDTVLIYNAGSGTVMSSAEASHKLTGVAVTPDGDKIVTDDASVAWTVSVQDGKYTFSQGEKVLGAVQSGTYNNITTGATAHNAWTLSKGTADATWYVKNDTYPANATYGPYYLEYYNGYTIYASNNPSDGQFGFVFYRLGGALTEDPGETPDPEPETAYATKMTELPNDGDTIIIYNSGNAMGSAASGKKQSAVAAEVTDNKLPLADGMAQLLVTIDEDGKYIFTLDGKYLTSADTGNGLSFAEELTDCGKWTMEAVDGADAWYIKNVGANYNGNYNQALEYYSGFTTYGIKETAIYQMQLYLVKAAPAAAGKLTSADQFVTGTYAMVVDGGYAMGALDGTWVSVVQPVIDGDVVTDAKGGVWTLTVNGSSVQITDSNGASIKPKGGNNNGIASGSYDWAWSFNEATQTFTFAGTGSDTVKLASNANEDPTYGGFHKFRGYKNTTISGNPATYPCNFTLYKIAEQGGETGVLPNDGDKVVIYNLSAKGVLAAENDAQSIENALAEIVDGKAVPENGAVVFTVSKNGNYYRFYNETYGYLCSNGTGNNAFYSLEASEDADWTLTTGKKGGYNLESRTAKYNGKYSQYLEYYADSYKTYSMYNVTDYDIYEFCFYEVAEGVNVNGGIVNQPAVEFGTLVDAYVGADYTFTFTVDAVFGVKELAVKAGEDELTANADGSYTIPAEKVVGTELTITVTGKDTKDVAFSGEAKVTVKDEPVIGAVAPAAGSETKENKRPVISAEITNAGENPTVTMTVNGETVAAVYADGKVTYTPKADMADGRTSVTVTVKRADGKETSKTWAFTVGEAKYALYFGQLHSHTTYSDGSGSLDSALTYIKNLPDSANVDFVAFTDHSNYFDASGAANPEGALYDMSLGTAASQKTWSEYTGAIDAFNASQSDVIALGGFEMTWSGGPGHINTFNTPGIVSRNNSTLDNKTNDAGMKAYYALLSQPEGVDSISQFNHPGSTFGTFSDFAYWDAVVDTRIQLVEVGNGEGQIGAGGYYPSYEYYTMALDKGWHVAPTNNQDNHKGKWGNANDARDVVLTDDFSEAGIYQAIRDMRVYSTEDKNLEILYTVNDQLLGSSITEVPEKLNISVIVNDPDAADSISKVEVIVNSGKVAHTWDNPAELAAGALSVELDPDYSYYYIRVTEGDGDLAVTAPVWVGEMLKLGISAVECGTSTPVTGEELTLTTTLFNSELQEATVKSLVYTINGSEVIGTDAAGYTIPASGTVGVDFKYTPEAAKVSKITVTALVEQDGKEYTFSMDITLDVQDADKLVYIGIDASHYNEYVNGNYKDSMGNFGQLAAEYNVRTVQLNTSADLIAACGNEKFKAIILTAPSRRSAEAQAANPLKVYTAEELSAIDAFNQAGGVVILAGWSDHYENYPDVASIKNMKAEEHMAATQNAVLEALGSSLRIGDDATYDDTYNGGQAYRLYFNTYGDSFLTEGVEVDAEHPHDRLYTEVFSHYGGASVYTVPSALPATVEPVVFGHSGTYSVDVDKDGLGGDSMPKYACAEGDERLMIMATEQLDGRGLIIVSGAAFMSNFEVQATIEDNGSEKNYSNYKVCENLLEYINPVTITDIAEVQAQTEVGYKYTIEGIVTSNASGYDKDTAFFDCIYVQDATGGICCFPVAGNYKIGDKVRVTGTTEFYQGEMELQVTSIEVIGEGAVEPKEVTAAQINDLSVIGQLITIKGTVESFELANGLVQTIMVKDAKGDVARVFIDGYITTAEDVKNLKVGCEITVTGISSYDNTFNAPEGPFPRIRIRDRADIVCGDVVVSPDTTPDTGDHTNLPLLTGAMLVSMAGILVILFAEKKRRA